jgi:hypothetical protein
VVPLLALPGVPGIDEPELDEFIAPFPVRVPALPAASVPPLCADAADPALSRINAIAAVEKRFVFCRTTVSLVRAKNPVGASANASFRQRGH